MGPQVRRHGRTLREPLLTDGAGERLLPAVRAQVGRQVCGLRERLAADLAVVGLLAAVRPHVCLEG